MFLSDQEVEKYKENYSGPLTPSPLDIIVYTIVSFVQDAVELHSLYPKKMQQCIKILKNDCIANMESNEAIQDLTVYRCFRDLPNLTRNITRKKSLEDFVEQHYRIAQISKKNLSNFELDRVLAVVMPAHRSSAQNILLHFLEKTLQHFKTLEKNKIITPARTAQSSVIMHAAIFKSQSSYSSHPRIANRAIAKSAKYVTHTR